MTNAVTSKILRQQLAQTGALIFAKEDVPLNDGQWQALEAIIKQVDYEHIIGGDAGEGHSVHVSRFVNDVIEPVDLQPQASAVKEIVMSEAMLAFYQRFIGDDSLCLRRCQANLLKHSDYIGVHIDQHSNIDYLASIVFHFDSDYQGGDFVSQPKTDAALKFHPKPYSLVVNRGDVWHEVEPVISGERRTLACFLSHHFGKSQHARKAFTVS